MPKRIQCCLCSKFCECQYGHNPEPCINMSDDRNHHLRCCDNCNQTKVRPARMEVYRRTGRWESTYIWSAEQQQEHLENMMQSCNSHK